MKPVAFARLSAPAGTDADRLVERRASQRPRASARIDRRGLLVSDDDHLRALPPEKACPTRGFHAPGWPRGLSDQADLGGGPRARFCHAAGVWTVANGPQRRARPSGDDGQAIEACQVEHERAERRRRDRKRAAARRAGTLFSIPDRSRSPCPDPRPRRHRSRYEKRRPSGTFSRLRAASNAWP